MHPVVLDEKLMSHRIRNRVETICEENEGSEETLRRSELNHSPSFEESESSPGTNTPLIFAHKISKKIEIPTLDLPSIE